MIHEYTPSPALQAVLDGIVQKVKDLVAENERLKKENVQLKQMLALRGTYGDEAS